RADKLDGRRDRRARRPRVTKLTELRMSGLRGPQETVSHIACVNIVSRDCTDRIVGKRDGALEGAGARARHVERGESTTQRAHKPVIDVARVHILSRDRPWRVVTLG